MSENIAQKKINPATQQFLNIAEIREDVVVLRNGAMRGILMVSSINFALKSEEEQNAIVSSYVGFLNSIDFPIQIVIQSREMNIDHYLADLRIKEKEQMNELLKIQTAEYIQYISELVSMSRIMNKYFFIVVPYDFAEDHQKSFFSRMSELFQPVEMIRMKTEKFLEKKKGLIERMEKVLGGLQSMGLNATMLDTQGLIELYYNTYNPGMAATQKMAPIDKLRVD